jgi:hypothetical protein
MSDRFIVVYVAAGQMEGELLKSFLQARGIQCVLSEEAVGWVYGFGVGPLAEVQVLVPSHQGKQARAALKQYQRRRKRE